MKTIEQRADEYIGHSFDIKEPLIATRSRVAFIEGAKSEYEELTRWNDPKEEVPNDDRLVLVKTIAGDYVVDFYIHELERFYIEDVDYAIVVGWREIYE